MIFIKAEVLEAFQVSSDFDEARAIAEWCDGKVSDEINPETDEHTPGINVQTMFGVKRASMGDYIVKNVYDEFQVVNEATYNQD